MGLVSFLKHTATQRTDFEHRSDSYSNLILDKQQSCSLQDTVRYGV